MLIFRFSSISGRFEITGIAASGERPRGTFRPHVDISYHDRVFTIRMDLPGVVPENLLIEADEHEISIAGVVPPPDKPGPCRLMERASGQFRRTISFPGRIAPDKVDAHLSGGVLTLSVPAPELERDPTRIEVNIQGAD